MQVNIRTFDFKMSPDERRFLHQLVDQVIDEGHLSNHTIVEKIENEFAAWAHTSHVVAVNNGTSALIAALQSFKEILPAKKTKVLLSTNTFVACWYAVIQAGFTPVIMDSSVSMLGFDISDVEREISKDDVAAIMAVHLGGIIDPQLEEIIKLCKNFGVLVLEDAAHAHGSHLKGSFAGSLGDAAAFSFHLTKTITAGEGGAVTTNNIEIYELLKSIRQFGKSHENPHYFDRVGGNYKMSEMQAAFLLTDLHRAKDRIGRREQIADIYFHELKNSSLQFFRPEAGSQSSYYKCMALLPTDSRPKLIAELLKNNISMPNGVYYWPMHVQPVVKLENKKFPNADKFSNQHICLPCYPELTDEQVHYFIDVFKRCERAGLV